MWSAVGNSYDDGVFTTEIYLRGQMKTKLIPMLAGLVTLSVVVVPFAVKADAIYNGQPLVAQAQDNSRMGKGPWAQLNLTDAQKQQMRQLKEETQNLIKDVLTPEQQAQVAAARQQNQPGQNRQRRNMMKSLNLTEAQKAKIKEIRQAQKAKMGAILTPEQQQQLQQMRSSWQQRRQR